MDPAPKIVQPLGTPEEVLAALGSIPAIDMKAVMRSKYQEEFESIVSEWNEFVERHTEAEGLPYANLVGTNRIEIRRNDGNFAALELDHSNYPYIFVSGTLGEGSIKFNEKFIETLAYRFLNPDWNDSGNLE